MTVQIIISLLFPFLSLFSSLLPINKTTKIDFHLRLLFVLMFVTELLGFLIPLYSEKQNYFIYNMYTLGFFMICYSVFYQLSKSTRWKKIILWLSFGLILFFFYDNFYKVLFFDKLQFKTFVAGAVILIILCIQYLVRFLHTDEIYDFYYSRSFWFSCGLLLFTVPFIPIIIGFQYMVDVKNLEILQFLSKVLIISSHICFIISFRWTRLL